MKTPKHYSTLIDRGILTTEIVASVLYSLNKRAKNLKSHNLSGYKKAKKARNLKLLGITGDAGFRNVKFKAMDYYRKKDLVLISLFQPSMMHIIEGVEYLFFKVHNSEFHFPLYIYESYGLKPPPDLEVDEGFKFQVQGEDVERLLSVQFCDKVLALIESGNFILIDGNSVNIDLKLVKKIQKKLQKTRKNITRT